MNLQQFLERRALEVHHQPRYRTICRTCAQPGFSCYCEFILSFDPKIEFIILIHPIEVRRRVATGRMSHLLLQGSRLISGHDFSNHPEINQTLQNPSKNCFILWPGTSSLNLADPAHQNIFQTPKHPVVFVIDGTWATARKMLRLSQNLHPVPRISFPLTTPSNFRVRKQPKPHCLSTIEAIHQVLEFSKAPGGFSSGERNHDRLLSVFDKMVERQLAFGERSKENPELCRYYRARQRNKTP
jgi:DTW domain-containing protein YfiP